MSVPFLPAAARWRARAEPWWLARSARERLLLSILSAVLLVIVAIFLVIRPLQTARATALADIRTYDSLLIRLRTSAPAPSTPRRTGDLPTIATSSAAQFGIPLRVTAAQGTKLAVQADGASYEALVRWLANLHDTSNVRVARITLRKAADAGAVNAAMVLSR